MISAKVVADSTCNGHRITSMLVTMPRIILAEAKTHRMLKKTDEEMEHFVLPGVGFNDDEMLSRNSASSRAIPTLKMIQAIEKNPFVPLAWQREHSGMQGYEYITDPADIAKERDEWLNDMEYAIDRAKARLRRGITKQLINRQLEPFMYHTVLVTATEWENFFHLRCPQYAFELDDINTHIARSRKDVYKKFPEQKHVLDGLTDLDWLRRNVGQAEIHMMAVAEAMWDARSESVPKELKPGAWHIPFGDNLNDLGAIGKEIAKAQGRDVSDFSIPEIDMIAVKIATARAARTSYTVVGEEGKPADYKKDIELHDKLVKSGHWSPAEHCARAMDEYELKAFVKTKSLYNHQGTGQTAASVLETGWCHNYRGWVSYRSTFPNENKV